MSYNKHKHNNTKKNNEHDSKQMWAEFKRLVGDEPKDQALGMLLMFCADYSSRPISDLKSEAVRNSYYDVVNHYFSNNITDSLIRDKIKTQALSKLLLSCVLCVSYSKRSDLKNEAILNSYYDEASRIFDGYIDEVKGNNDNITDSPSRDEIKTQASRKILSFVVGFIDLSKENCNFALTIYPKVVDEAFDECVESLEALPMK